MRSGNRSKWESEGATAPLFDRLQDSPRDTPSDPDSMHYTKSEVINSIQRDVSLLLNTRCMVSKESYEKLNPAALDYGIPELYGMPDFSAIDPESVTTWDHSAKLIQTALRLFEPRLKNPRVTIQKFDAGEQELYTEITAHAIIGKYIEQVKFPVIIDNMPINKAAKKG